MRMPESKRDPLFPCFFRQRSGCPVATSDKPGRVSEEFCSAVANARFVSVARQHRAGEASLAVKEFEIKSVEPYVDPRYEWVTGVVSFAVDPDHPANRCIVDLDRARRDADGCVHFDADLRLLRSRGQSDGPLLLAVPNRGMLGGVPFSLGGVVDLQNMENVDPGDGFLLDRGWTVAWCGWQWDVLRGPGRLGLTAPEVEVEPGWLRMEWRPDTASNEQSLSASMPGFNLFRFADYPTVDTEDPDAVLTVRTSPEGEPVLVPREAWRFTDDIHVSVEGGFAPFHWYQLVYRSARAPVAGCGLLAVRDLVSHLRETGMQRAYAFGASQCGRFLRQMLWEGLNVDESGRTVFDGMFCHIAGAHRGEFNHRYAQPALTEVHGFADLPPFDDRGLLARQRRLGGVPKVIMTNSGWEYWRGDAALTHIDARTGTDLAEDADVRSYLIAGTDHFGNIPIKHLLAGSNPTHTLDATPVHRALLVALDRWVDGEEPPASRVPRVSDGTAATRGDVLTQFDHAARPDVDALPWQRSVDLGGGAERGVGRWPARLGQRYPDFVSTVDADGNEVAGVRLPAVAVPAAAYTGWNPRRSTAGLPNTLYERLGSKLAFPPGRPTVVERYSTPADYTAAAQAVAQQLADERLLLPQDIGAVVASALEASGLDQP